MKIQTSYTFALLSTALLLVASAGCGGGEETAADPAPPPSDEVVSEEAPEGSDHSAHDHKHGPNGLPVVDLSDGSEIEWDFDEDTSEFTVIPVDGESVNAVRVETVVEGNEKTYEFEQQETEDDSRWVLTNEELGTAMMMGDAVERTLVVETEDGDLTAAVQHFEGH